MKTESYPLNAKEHATVLAALRYYQEQGLADDGIHRPRAIHEIATGGNGRFRHGLTADGIDRLCERLNRTGDGAGRKARWVAKTETVVTGQLYAPNGRRIVAAKDWIPGNASITGATRNTDGTLEIVWGGETRLCWEGQYTEIGRGGRVFLDEAGNEWRERQLTVAETKGE